MKYLVFEQVAEADGYTLAELTRTAEDFGLSPDQAKILTVFDPELEDDIVALGYMKEVDVKTTETIKVEKTETEGEQ